MTDGGLAPWGTPGPEPVLVVIGDIQVTPTRVFTPMGSAPLRDVTFTVANLSQTTEAIPSWAIVCAILFALFCLLGLLFLLAKEERTTGWVQVTVHGPGLLHTVALPAWSRQNVWDVHARVHHAQAVAAQAR